MPTDLRLQTFYDLAARGEEDRLLDALYDFFDDLLQDGRFEDCDRLLVELEVERLGAVGMVGLLTILAPASRSLREWPSLLSRVRSVFLRTMSAERAAQMLRGIDP